MKIDSRVVTNPCNSDEHSIEFAYDNDMMYFHIYLAKTTFFKRVWLGIKYIFGYQCKYGEFDTVYIPESKLNDFQQLIHEYKFDRKRFVESKKPIEQRMIQPEYDNI